MKKGTKVVKRNFTQKDEQISNKNMRRYSPLLVIRKVQIETTIKKKNYSPTKMDLVKETDNIEYCKMWRNWKLHTHL